MLKIKDIVAFEGHSVEVTGDDGYPVGIVIPCVNAVVADGRTFALPNDLRLVEDEEGFCNHVLRFDLYKAREIAEAARGRGYINEANWIEVEVDTQSLEDRWAEDAYREQEDRFYGR